MGQRGRVRQDRRGRRACGVTVPLVKFLETDVCVVGAGAAGLYTALRASREGARVTLVSATALAESSSYWAQGGLAAALADDDSPELHLADTIAAGRGMVRVSAARVLCDEAARAVDDLTSLGMRFDRDASGAFALGLEGGHSARRILHAGGAATGRRLLGTLSGLVAEEDRIEVLEGRRAMALLTAENRCVGVRLDDGRAIVAAAVVMATGGAAALWARTTNPPGATGEGLLLAHAAGAALADLEMMQFHPTAVVAKNGPDGFLVTEAVRGEGALLLDSAAGTIRRRARSARRGGARHPSPDARDRNAVCLPRHARGRPYALPECGRARSATPASTRHGSSCRWPPPPIT